MEQAVARCLSRDLGICKASTGTATREEIVESRHSQWSRLLHIRSEVFGGILNFATGMGEC